MIIWFCICNLIVILCSASSSQQNETLMSHTQMDLQPGNSVIHTWVGGHGKCLSSWKDNGPWRKWPLAISRLLSVRHSLLNLRRNGPLNTSLCSYDLQPKSNFMVLKGLVSQRHRIYYCNKKSKKHCHYKCIWVASIFSDFYEVIIPFSFLTSVLFPDV